MTDLILVSDENAVRTIRFNRSDKKNAITRAMYSAMAEALVSANTDPVRAAIIAGSDGVFSAGNDMIDFMESPPDFGGETLPPVAQFMRALIGCEKPVIAAVDGLAIGIGTTLLLHCDLVYATARSTFATPFVNLALAPEFGSSQILPGVVGRAVASELLLLGERWDAERAEAKLLINGILPEEGFEDAIKAKAQTLANFAPGAVKEAKKLINTPPQDLLEHMYAENEIFSAQLRSQEFNEAATAFMERRAPDFSKFG